MENITKYLNDYTSQEKKYQTNKKKSCNIKNTEIIQINVVEDNEIDSKEELNDANKTKNKRKKNKYSHLEKNNLKWNPLWTSKYSYFMEQMNHNQALIIGCMCNVYYLIQYNIALNNYKSLYDLITYQINYQYQTVHENFIQNLRPPSLQNHSKFITSSSNSNYALYKNPVAGKEFLSSIFTIIKEKVIAEVKESPCWNLLVDESNTNIISEKTIALVLKHLVNGEPVFCFFGLTQITDASADRIMNVINLFINQKELDIIKLRHFDSGRTATISS
ncbi:hypothetical protein C1645_837454 [Glomus cerebriforme]|uniref:DUF4371 domain-containing protein n=1 Tax=Glomus cerebriforme TaxID=658196 RepID=A0A397SEG6_9GLOM|nr:hypothetical protein C1645_837454 [Glomus cerebriforme]